MIIVAIVRVLGFSINSAFTWGLFWHQAEAATAIIMVSITAFRSLLGLKAQKAQKKKEMERSWFAHRPKLLAKKVTEDESESEQLPSIPGATLSGMRTFIDGNEIWDGVNGIGKIHQLEWNTPEDARLGRGLVFNNEIAALQRMHIRRNTGSGKDSRQPRGGIRAFSGKRRPEQRRVGEKGRTDVRAE